MTFKMWIASAGALLACQSLMADEESTATRELGTRRQAAVPTEADLARIVSDQVTLIFRLPDANYAQKNAYWSSWGIKDLIASCDEKDRKRFTKRVEALQETYDEMSEIYQKSKDKGAEIPLK